MRTRTFAIMMRDRYFNPCDWTTLQPYNQNLPRLPPTKPNPRMSSSNLHPQDIHTYRKLTLRQTPPSTSTPSPNPTKPSILLRKSQTIRPVTDNFQVYSAYMTYISHIWFLDRWCSTCILTISSPRVIRYSGLIHLNYLTNSIDNRSQENTISNLNLASLFQYNSPKILPASWKLRPRYRICTSGRELRWWEVSLI